jgi:cyanamide hydratase
MRCHHPTSGYLHERVSLFYSFLPCTVLNIYGSNSGNIMMIGQILQLATILDNIGMYVPNLGSFCYYLCLNNHVSQPPVSLTPHPSSLLTTCTGWSNHFAGIVEKELRLKHWCHSTTFEVPGHKEGMESNFAKDVRGNEAGSTYD